MSSVSSTSAPLSGGAARPGNAEAFDSAHPALAVALVCRGYAAPTPVQAEVLAAPDRDLLVSAQTGSGKTVAFGLGMARRLLGDAARFGRPGAPLALVVTPTRELAQQVFRELEWLYADTGARIATCVGGFDPRREQRALAQGVHLVVGTPGRLRDHLERGALVLDRLSAVVLDEADEMLDMGFREDLERLLDSAPGERLTLLFSATIPGAIATLARRYQRGALRIATQGEREVHRDIEYHAVPIVPRERDLAVVNLLRYHDAGGALVFCATREGTTRLAANLHERGFAVVALSGELSQRERSLALESLRDRRARVCVATDVAARGLDLPDLGIVIHADLPQNKEVLVHRSGRTGRAGRQGLAILLVPDPARRHVERLLRAAHLEATWMRGPTPEEIVARDQLQLAAEIRQLASEVDEEDREVARRLVLERSAEDLVATLVRSRRQARPAPEELSLPMSMRPGRPEGREGRERDRAPRHDRRADAGRAGPHRHREEARGRPTRPGRDDRPPPQHEGATWFTINVGRSKNADPKWLIPLLCRRGAITKRDIGKIQILARETRVEIAGAASARFAEAVRQPDAKDRHIHIEPLDGGI
jgi:ATP-dependent RNA helicase DeaD